MEFAYMIAQGSVLAPVLNCTQQLLLMENWVNYL